MTIDEKKNEAVKATIDELATKAVEVSSLARTQRLSADKLQASSQILHYEAHKLENLGEALQADLEKIKSGLK